MSQRINISVPDELATKLQELKGKFKISKICQDALTEAVMFEELKGSQDIEMLKKRMQKEKEQLFKEYKDEGFNDGLKDAHAFTYEQFKKYLYNVLRTDLLSNANEMLDELFDEFQHYASEESQKKHDNIEDGKLTLGELPSYFYSGNNYSGSPETHEASIVYFISWHHGVQFVCSQLKMK